MRLLIENGAAHLGNLGDAAMLQIAVQRLRKYLPEAQLHVVTGNPGKLRGIDPELIPLPLQAVEEWVGTKHAFATPKSRAGRLSRQLKAQLKWRFAARAARRFVKTGRHPDNLVPLIQSASAVLSSGGGLINRKFPKNSHRLLHTLRLAQALGKPTAAFGLGIDEPVDQRMQGYCRDVFPGLSCLALRESLVGSRFIANLGRPIRWQVTGDDAIGLVPESLPSTPAARHIGINIRLARHTAIPRQTLPVLKNVISSRARREQLRLRNLPVTVIERPHRDSDCKSTSELFGSEIDQWPEDCQNLTPRQLILATGQCRLVISVSYHACVFALALGIPTIALYADPYYHNKHAGLCAMFGNLSSLVDLRQPDFEAQLQTALDRELNRDRGQRLRLRELAARQRGLSEQAYAGFCQKLAALSQNRQPETDQ